MLTLLGAAAVIAGLTGAWSPCGFSMVETLAPHGYAGSRRMTLAACATFGLGAVAGGVLTFGGLALIGAGLGAGSAAAAQIAAAIALLAAVGEARGARIVPQVRRQVPESWRRVLPVTVAAGLYGVLLGLGFTTFILTFAVWALAALCVALGEPGAGLVVGLGFGLGRALPVLLLAPIAASEAGSRAHAAMAERPAILRGLRALDAAALLACALALAAGPASAADRLPGAATDPGADGDLLVYQAPGAGGRIARSGVVSPLPGRFPAAGGGLVAWTDATTITIAAAATLAPVASVPAAGADALAVSATWVAWRTGRSLRAARIDGSNRRTVTTGALGRPALDGNRIAFHVSSRSGSRLESMDLATGVRQTLASARRALLLHPALLGDALLYIRSTATRQVLVLREAGAERVLYSTTPTARRDLAREPGQGRHRHGASVPPLPARPDAGRIDTLWTTALTPTAAYVTRLRARVGGGADAVLLRVARAG